jgi:hypothetical protein
MGCFLWFKLAGKKGFHSVLKGLYVYVSVKYSCHTQAGKSAYDAMIGTSLRVYQSRAFFERNRAAPLDNPAKQFDFIGVLVTITTILAILPHLPPHL